MLQDRLDFEAIGTSWQILSEQLPETLITKIKERIATFDQTYSRFRNDSLITEISQKAGIYTFPRDSQKLFAVYKKLYDVTEGKFTPLIGQLIADAGYDSTYSFREKPLQEVPKWKDVMSYTFPKLTTKQKVLLDFGAAGKGYLIDIIGSMLVEADVQTFSINAGGDILYKHEGARKLRVGLEHPSDTKKIIGVVSLEKGSICGSAGNRRTWGSFHHIFDPYKKTSISDILAVWVVADTAVVADALSTCLFVAPKETLETIYPFEYAIMKRDTTLVVSDNFPAEFY